jgi:hypothetical protein
MQIIIFILITIAINPITTILIITIAIIATMQNQTAIIAILAAITRLM